MMAIKRIMRYLKGTEDYGLYYKKNENFELSAYIDANWASNIDERKSNNGGAFFLGKRLVSWTSKKKKYMSQSTIEVEYVVVVVNCSNVVWLKQLLKQMKSQMQGKLDFWVL